MVPELQVSTTRGQSPHGDRIAPIHFATWSSSILVAVACALGCAGRSDHTMPGRAGGSSSAGQGGSGIGAGTGGAGTGGAGAGGAGAGGTSAGQGGSGAAGALPACLLPAESGPCNAYFERFAFNAVTLTCEPFVYGG